MTRAQELEKRLGDATANVVTQNRPRWFPWLKSDKQQAPGVRQVAAWIGLASGGMDDGKWLGTDRRIRIG